MDGGESQGRQAVILLAPSGGGKDTVIRWLCRFNFLPCIRETTRTPRQDDDGNYTFVDQETFELRLKQGLYLLPNYYSNHWYGVPAKEVQRAWQIGKVPILKGRISEIAAAKSRLTSLQAGVVVTTIYMSTDPPDAWQEVLKERGFKDSETRIKESGREMKLVQPGERYHQLVDHFITNRFGQLERTVYELRDAIASAMMAVR